MCELFDRYWNDGVPQGMTLEISRGMELGVSQGIVQSIQQLLSCHGAVSEELKERVGSEKDIHKLSGWVAPAGCDGYGRGV